MNTTILARGGRTRKRLSLLAAATLLGAGISVVGLPSTEAHATSSPTWWHGTTCDTYDYPGSYALAASYNGVQACGPGPYQGGSDHTIHFTDSNGNQVGVGEFEWECVELSMRYMYLVYGIAPYYLPNGAQDIVSAYSGNVLTKVSNASGSGNEPAPGDILAFAASSNHPVTGHTAVVTAVNISGNGNGTVTYMQQNVGSNNGWGSVSVTNFLLGDSVSGWLHHAVSSPPTLPPPNVYHVFDGTTSGALHETYWGGGNSLTSYQLANVAQTVASVAYAQTSDGVKHVFDGDANGSIHETYWGGGQSLTSYQLANVGAQIASIAYIRTSDGVNHVFDGDTNGVIHETYWGGGQSLTSYQLASIGSSNPITSIVFKATSDGVFHVFSASSSGAIYETYWGGGQSLTTYQVVNVGHPIASIAFDRTTDGVNHVFDGDTNGVIHETYWGGGQSLTSYQLANVGQQIASISEAVTGDGVMHIFDGDTNGSIHETYWGGGQSLTTYQLANVGQQIASIVFAVTFDGVYHVFDGDTNGMIHETYWNGGQSLTTYQLANVGSPIVGIAFAATTS